MCQASVPANNTGTEHRYPLSRLGNEQKECEKNEKVDFQMAELSIIGLVLGSVGFIATLRNGIQTVLHDADAFKAQPEVLEPLAAKLSLLSIKIETWQSFWHIHNGSPGELFSSYWGERGSRDIRRLLSHVHGQFKK